MSRILVIYDSVMPTVELISKTIQGFSNKFGLDFQRLQTNSTKEMDIDDSDVIICVRGESPLMLGILEYAEKQGKRRMFFLDDDLKDIPRGTFRFSGRKKWLMKCLNKCEILLTSNELIADEYKEFVSLRKAAIIHTDVAKEELVQPIEIERDCVKIVYAASEKHIDFFETYIRPIMKPLFDRFGKKIHFYFIGVNPVFDAKFYPEQVTCIHGMDYAQYIEFMKKESFDIGLAPLKSNHFMERKYFNKFLEYSKMGICGIYSDCMPYRLVVADKVNGYLAENTYKSWFDAVEFAVGHYKERNECVRNAQNYILQNHEKNIIYSHLAENVPEIFALSDKMVQGIKIGRRFQHKLFRVIESVYLTALALKKYGPEYTILRIKRKIGGKV